MPKNYYIILGLPFNSTQEDIKAAYRRLAKEYHPDHYGGNRKEFLNVQEAYSVLSDPVRRRDYDSTLDRNSNKQAPRKESESRRRDFRQAPEPLIPERGPVFPGYAGPIRSSQSYEPSLKALLDRLSAGFAAKRYFTAEQPENLTVAITVTPEQARRGGHVKLYLAARMQCPSCGGRGRLGLYKCRHCDGAGSLAGEYPVLVQYPPGIADNHTVRRSLNRLGGRNAYLTVTFRLREMV